MTNSTTNTLQVIATGKVAPYGIGEVVETISETKTAIKAAYKAGHRVEDAEGNRVEVIDGKITRY